MKIKSRYKFIHFKWEYDKPKTKVMGCYNNASNACLGEISWYGPWRQYCFFPDPLLAAVNKLVFNSECQKDIAHYLDQVNKAHRINKENRKDDSRAQS